MSTKTKFVTALTINMIVFSIGFGIPSIIEGINIGKNYQSYNANNQLINPDNYFTFKWDLKGNDKLNIYVVTRNATTGFVFGSPIVFSIMDKDQFESWYAAGELKPKILNSTYLYEQSYLNLKNLNFENDGEYYLIFYNDNADAIKIDFTVRLIPWGHITATSIVGFGLLLCLSILIAKMITTIYFVRKSEKSTSTVVQYQYSTDDDRPQPQSPVETEAYCVSCGAPVTPKTGKYCQNCGASVKK